ncbi:MAG: hypothetical protein P8182_14145 [Deltaproteobacteria bacterium]
MGNLTNDMARLREEITAMSNARRAQTIDREIENEKMKVGESSMLKGMREAHEAMARDAGGYRAKFVSDLTADVHALRDMFRQELAGSAAERKRTQEDFDARLKKAVANLRSDAARMMKDHRQSLAQMQLKSKKDREDFVSSLQHEVSAMQQAFHRFQANLGQSQRKELQGFVADLKDTVDSLVGGFASDRAGARDAWHWPVRHERKSGGGAEPKRKVESGVQAGEQVESTAARNDGGAAGTAAGVQEGDIKEPVRGGTGSAPSGDSPGKSRKKGKK